MPKPITHAVAQLIVLDTLGWLEKKLAEVDAEHQQRKANSTFNERYLRQADHLQERRIYLEIALRQAIGALGGSEAEEAVKRILGSQDDHCFGVCTRASAELSVDSARRAARHRKSAQQGAAA